MAPGHAFGEHLGGEEAGGLELHSAVPRASGELLEHRPFTAERDPHAGQPGHGSDNVLESLLRRRPTDEEEVQDIGVVLRLPVRVVVHRGRDNGGQHQGRDPHKAQSATQVADVLGSRVVPARVAVDPAYGSRDQAIPERLLDSTAVVPEVLGPVDDDRQVARDHFLCNDRPQLPVDVDDVGPEPAQEPAQANQVLVDQWLAASTILVWRSGTDHG